MKNQRPPMGWNSYDYYDTTVNEEQIRANADYMAEHLREYGWEYIVVDIAWYSHDAGMQREKYQYVPFCNMEMDEYSRLLPCPKRFPSSAGDKGFGPLADYVHGKGLKFGIHIMRGIPRLAAHNHTKILGSERTANEIANPYSICSWNPDMYGVVPGEEGAQEYYDSLMALYAGWGVDFVKCDDICRMDAGSSKEEIRMLHKAIQKCERDIVLSLSPGPAIVDEAEFYHENATMWRITDDFWDSWSSLRDMFDRCRSWQEHVRDGGYPDCDMLPLGWLGKGFDDERQTNFTKDEQRTMMTLWCIFRSPLMLGAELTTLDKDTLALLTNAEVLRLLSVSEKARESYRDENTIVWHAGSRSEEAEYLAVFNISDKKNTVSVSEYTGRSECKAEDLWNHTPVDMFKECELPAHGCALYKISGYNAV